MKNRKEDLLFVSQGILSWKWIDPDTVSMEYLMANLPDAVAKNKLREFVQSILNMKSSLFDMSKDSLPMINHWIEKTENLNIVTRDFVDEEFCNIVCNKNFQ